MHSKQELIQLGMYDHCREDVYYLVGLLYDLVKANDFVLDGSVKNDFENQLQNITIPNYNGDISKAKTIYDCFTKVFKGQFTSIRRNSNKINNTNAGVYGIYVNDLLVYIGSTINFQHRFSQHKSAISIGNENIMYTDLHNAKKNGKTVSMKILIDLSKEQHCFTVEELRAMEFGLIKVLKPKYNYAGVHADFYNGYK